MEKLKKPKFLGWATSDEDEIKRRKYRAQQNSFKISSLETEYPFFGSFTVNSQNKNYLVEIRSFIEPFNSCDCFDYQINSLGTCKHIEAALLFLIKKFEKTYEQKVQIGSKRVEIFLQKNKKIAILWPRQTSIEQKNLLEPFFSSDGTLLTNPITGFKSIFKVIERSDIELSKTIRISEHIESWLNQEQKKILKSEAKKTFLDDLEQGKRTLDILKVKLYSYQEEGILHLVFNERVLLADEMGLGKTIQAIGACELLRRLKGIEKVLIISPASLKNEWIDQIEKYIQLKWQKVQGNKLSRLKSYRKESFFYLCNYEQIRQDFNEIQEILMPDVIILDEAQRIKNWQTKAARSVKQIYSPYVFVLTGTPLENCIDEIYSIMQVIDPSILGPLFKFNREYYDLDEKGNPKGHKNLNLLHHQLKPYILRRLKSEVEDQLPKKTINNYFVKMSEEQVDQYEVFNTKLARLLAILNKRPLTKDERDEIQKYLACMRMICDTPYILDSKNMICPKIEELEEIFKEVLLNNENKIIIFSEWEKMLELIRKTLIRKYNFEYALHTGKISQDKRKQEIDRFKKDPLCRLFLSTDSGSVGLNLQNANIVINMDLPWNPAKLEQRIARAWRKNQKKVVNVINLISEDTIESRMLQTLDEKQKLINQVLDGKTDVVSIIKENFVDRLSSLMNQKVDFLKQKVSLEDLQNDLLTYHQDSLELLQVYKNSENEDCLLAIVEPNNHNKIKECIEKLSPQKGSRIHLLDTKIYASINKLIQDGILKKETNQITTLHCSSRFENDQMNSNNNREEIEKKYFKAKRKMEMALCLAAGGFIIESIQPACQALELGALAIQALDGHSFEEKSLINKSLSFSKKFKKNDLSEEETKKSFNQLKLIFQDITKCLQNFACLNYTVNE